MKRYMLLLLFLGLVGCSSKSESPIIYTTIAIQEEQRYPFYMFDTDDLSQTSPDHTIIVDDISNFKLTGADLEELAFPDLPIRMYE